MSGGECEMTEDPGEEAAWRDLVAKYATPAAADGTPTPWPTREDLPGPGAPGEEGASPDGSGQDTADLDITGLDMANPDDPDADTAQPPGPRWPAVPGPFDGMNPGPPQIRIVRPASPAPLPGDDDDHFVPPEPPPMPRLDPVTKGAWVALFGGPAYLLIAVMLGWQVPSLVAFAAVACFVGGFATLVVRMGDRPPRDSGPDDGAVV
jgi:hypothetical protein